MILQKTGYGRSAMVSNLALGVFDGIDSVLWCYAFATIIFTNVLAIFLPLGLVIILGGWALLSIVVALTSRAPVHMIAIDEQAVVIIASIAVLMIADLGPEAASLRGLATLLAIMSLVSLAIAISLYLASRYQISALLELLPYPVICGFMAGIGWLLLDAAVVVIVDLPISVELWSELRDGKLWSRLLICIAGGLFLLAFTALIEKTWALPVASSAIVVLFYAAAIFSGYDIESLRQSGWMFDISTPQGGITQLLVSLNFSQIDFAFIASVLPQIMTILFLTLLAASMNLSTLAAINLKANLNTATEMKAMGAGNFLCAAICCPPGYTDAPASVLYDGFGAKTRWMPLASSAVCLLAAVGGDWIVNYTPRVLIAATIFLFAFQLFYDWMYANVRSFSRSDYAIVCAILLTVMTLGFMQGILVGIILSLLLFVLRYSMIPPIQDQYSLNDHRSSVERSVAAGRVLEKHGGQALVYTLRGYLFFGTANRIRDTLNDNLEHGQYRSLLLDLRRVTGIDVSALNAFAQIKQICDGKNIELIYACQDAQICSRLISADAVGFEAAVAGVYADADFALERMEQDLLDYYGDPLRGGSVREQLLAILDCDDKVQMLLDVMIRIEYQSGDVLFHQGDPDSGFYLLESGAMSALIDSGNGQSQRVKKFSAGSVIGELSSYTLAGTRTASVIADTAVVLYYLNPARLPSQDVVHELVARTMGLRMDYMNRRLLWELA